VAQGARPFSVVSETPVPATAHEKSCASKGWAHINVARCYLDPQMPQEAGDGTQPTARTSLPKCFAAKAIDVVSRFAETSPAVASSLLRNGLSPDQGDTMLPWPIIATAPFATICLYRVTSGSEHSLASSPLSDMPRFPP